MIDFESKVVITQLSAWMDGGSITLQCRNALNQEFEIEFVQNVNWDWYEAQNIPGRMYLNQKLIKQRSHLEAKIIEAIGSSSFKSGELYDKIMLDEKLEYVKSDKYLTDQSKIKKIK